MDVMGNLSSLLSLCLESFKNAESVFLLRLLICLIVSAKRYHHSA